MVLIIGDERLFKLLKGGGHLWLASSCELELTHLLHGIASYCNTYNGSSSIAQ